MASFSIDDNGIWVSSNDAYQVKYPEKGSQTSEILENEGSFWFLHRNNVIYEIVKRYPFSNSFADIGGGNGFQILSLKKRIPEPAYFLIEPGYNACKAASRRGLKLVYNCTFQEFDFNSNKVNGFGLFDVLEHIPDDVQFLNSLYNSMPPNSYLYITVPAHQYLWNDVDDYGKHQRRYDLDSMNRLVSKTPFSITYFSYFFSYLVLPTYLIRTIPYKLFGGRTDEQIIKAEFGLHIPNPLVTKLFDFLGSAEVNKIKSGNAIGNGASCVIVLKK